MLVSGIKCLMNAVISEEFNPFLANGFSHVGESTVNFRGVRGEFKYLFHFSMEFL